MSICSRPSSLVNEGVLNVSVTVVSSVASAVSRYDGLAIS